MALIDNVKRINIEEFKDDDKEVAERIANIYNYFAEQVTNAINGNIDFDNLRRTLMNFDVVIASNGVPVGNRQFLSTVGLKGINVINVVNNTNKANYLISHPFVSFTAAGNGTYTIDHITGLNPANKYTLTLELIF